MNETINKLTLISYNLYWSWQPDFFSLFEEIDEDKWEWSNHNPVKFLNEINHDLLSHIIVKKDLAGKIESIYSKFKKYMEQKTYDSPSIAYFSAEYGLTECLKIYSGGLGILSGDHLKSSSDINLPLCGVGLAYSNGYFTQYINESGRQSEAVEKNDFSDLPIFPVKDIHNNHINVEIDFPDRKVFALIWKISVGRTSLYLLDTNTPLNNDQDRYITDTLYGGDNEKRIQQEIVLGIGGIRLLKKLGYDINAFHINEGHSAFLCVERIKDLMEEHKLSFSEAKTICYESNVFTTHTPVPAGFDIFYREMMERYFAEYVFRFLKISMDEFMDEGNIQRGGNGNRESFNMAHLAINNAKYINGVSRLHGEVARKMWNLPPGRDEIGSVTNGIHTLTFLSKYSNELYKSHFGEEWHNKPEIWNKIPFINDLEMWEIREKNRRELINFCRKRFYLKNLIAGKKIEDNLPFLDEKALTIGFARRFATYKRGNLIFSDRERLKKIISDPERPVQFIFSGKAHPRDEEGKNFISEIVSYTEDSAFKNKIIFLENYSIEIAKYLVQGCDVWLNNPIRPLEASGTSGMKVIANGGLNFSILDGWWAEAYREENGWKIDSVPEESVSPDERNFMEVSSLYNILENSIIPLFYERNASGIPPGWIKKMKSSINNLAGYFNTSRMVSEYAQNYYMKIKEIHLV